MSAIDMALWWLLAGVVILTLLVMLGVVRI
jgi:hypothetical protein